MYYASILGMFVCLTGVSGQDSLFSGKDTINVKTVLFRDTDSSKPCWAMEDVHLLVTRKMLQDLVPKKLPGDFNKLAVYVRTVLDIVKTKSPPQSAQRITLAAYDVMGGYLKAIGIPILNEAYYAGNVPYHTAAEIHCLYGRIMSYLKTDGGSWSGPVDMRRIPTRVQALTITICNSSDACNTLELRGSSHSPDSNSFESDQPKISIPYLDDNSYPNAIAIPLRGNSLFSLMSNCSANLLPKFYILAMRCLSSTCFTKKDILNFNHHFYDWIISSVMPHVHETDRWYPGFGGVMRIVETMNQRGLASLDNVRPDTSSGNNSLNVDGFNDCDVVENPFIIRFFWFIMICLTALICICFCICFCLYRMCFKPPTLAPVGVDESTEGLAKTLVSIYCNVKESIVGNKTSDTVKKKKKTNISKCKSSSRSATPNDDFRSGYSSSEICDSTSASSGSDK